MRHFIRHPTDVPIEVQRASDHLFAPQRMHNVSCGGLEFFSYIPIEPDSVIALRFPYLNPAFEIPAARVAWCNRYGPCYNIGVQFTDTDEAFNVRMVEQICHIESYRHDVEEREGRHLSPEEAAEEWIKQSASTFPNP